MAKKKQDDIINDCSTCVSSLQRTQLNCKLKMKDNKENKYTFTDKAINCLWYKVKKDFNVQNIK